MDVQKYLDEIIKDFEENEIPRLEAEVHERDPSKIPTAINVCKSELAYNALHHLARLKKQGEITHADYQQARMYLENRGYNRTVSFELLIRLRDKQREFDERSKKSDEILEEARRLIEKYK